MSNIHSGFTLVELLLTISIFAIIAVAAFPVSRAFQIRSNLDIAAATVAEAVRRAETLARGMDGDSQWGIYAAANSITLFRGSSYAVRNVSFDEVSPMPSGIILPGVAELRFVKLTGFPTSAVALTITSADNETRTVTVNDKGMVAY